MSRFKVCLAALVVIILATTALGVLGSRNASAATTLVPTGRLVSTASPRRLAMATRADSEWALAAHVAW